jgi:glycosyltransferase involved in cell wall biosynthesis
VRIHRGGGQPEAGGPAGEPGALTFLSHHIESDGYGYSGYKIREALLRLGVRVEAVDMLDEQERYTRVGSAHWYAPGDAVALTVPPWWRDIDARRLYGFSMFESTKLPAGWAAAINETAEACLVPSHFCAEVFEANGVEADLEVAPLGVDPGDWWPLDRSGHEGPYTFLWSGTADRRKGWDLAYRAFCRAFGHREDVRLVLWFRLAPRGVDGIGDPNVKMMVGPKTRPEMRKLLAEADCFVYPARGEGFGLPPREAAATGLPVIATDWGGLSEEIGEWALPVRVAHMETAGFGFYRTDIGEWAVPDVDQVTEWMRWCAENPGRAQAAGDRAAEWMAQYGTWDRTARRVMEVVQGC